MTGCPTPEPASCFSFASCVVTRPSMTVRPHPSTRCHILALWTPVSLPVPSPPDARKSKGRMGCSRGLATQRPTDVSGEPQIPCGDRGGDMPEAEGAKAPPPAHRRTAHRAHGEPSRPLSCGRLTSALTESERSLLFQPHSPSAWTPRPASMEVTWSSAITKTFARPSKPGSLTWYTTRPECPPGPTPRWSVRWPV